MLVNKRFSPSYFISYGHTDMEIFLNPVLEFSGISPALLCYLWDLYNSFEPAMQSSSSLFEFNIKVETNANHLYSSRKTNCHLFTNPELRPLIHTAPNISQSRWTWPISAAAVPTCYWAQILKNKQRGEGRGRVCNHTEPEPHHLSNDGCIARQRRIKWHTGGCARKVRRVRGDAIKKDQSGWGAWSLNRKQKLSHFRTLECESCGAESFEAARLLLTHTHIVVAWQKKKNSSKGVRNWGLLKIMSCMCWPCGRLVLSNVAEAKRAVMWDQQSLRLLLRDIKHQVRNNSDTIQNTWSEAPFLTVTDI